jgi:hypothetical protein
MGRVGTLDIDALLQNQAAFQTVQVFGVDEFAAAVQRELQAHDGNVRDMVAGIAVPTNERLWTASAGISKEMFEADEYSQVPTQKQLAGYNMGAPLRKRQISVGWTREYFRRKTVGQMSAELLACEEAHILMLYRDVRRALYFSSNYTFAERLQEPLINIPVKRLINADSTVIEVGPNGEIFNGASHNHYLGSATLTAAAVQSAVNTVLEHRITAGLRIVISQTDRTSFEALTGFKSYPDPRIQFMNTDQNRQTIDLTRMNNLAIGTFSAAEVWVKPWAIANYVLVYDTQRPPLVFRTREGDLALQTAGEFDAFPLHTQFLESHYGFAVRNRLSAALLYFANGTYADPTIN